MQQSNVIFAAIIIAYILFITNRGELGSYIALLRGGGSTAGSAGSSASATAAGISSGLIDPGQVISNGVASEITSSLVP